MDMILSSVTDSHPILVFRNKHLIDSIATHQHVVNSWVARYVQWTIIILLRPYMNLEVPYQDTVSIRSLIKSMRPCVYKQGLYALPLFPDVNLLLLLSGFEAAGYLLGLGTVSSCPPFLIRLTFVSPQRTPNSFSVVPLPVFFPLPASGARSVELLVMTVMRNFTERKYFFVRSGDQAERFCRFMRIR